MILNEIFITNRHFQYYENLMYYIQLYSAINHLIHILCDPVPITPDSYRDGHYRDGSYRDMSYRDFVQSFKRLCGYFFSSEKQVKFNCLTLC